MKRNFYLQSPQLPLNAGKAANQGRRVQDQSLKATMKGKTKGLEGEGHLLCPFCGLFSGFFDCTLEVGLKKCRPFISGSYKYHSFDLHPPSAEKIQFSLATTGSSINPQPFAS